MNKSSDLLENRMQLLRREYALQLPAKIEDLANQWKAILQVEFQRENLKTIHRMVHTLAGTASSFGHAALGSTAKQMESLIKTLLESEEPMEDGIKAAINTSLERLKATCTDPDPGVDQGQGTTALSTQPVPVVKLNTEKKTVFLIEDDPSISSNLELQIGHFGYDVRTFNRLSDLGEALKYNPPSAIIMDIVSPKDGSPDSEAVLRMQKEFKNPIPIIFIASRSDFEARLKGVRLGGEAFLIKPVNINALIDKLDILTSGRTPPEPYRILIIDDDPQLSSYFSLILQKAEMSTMVINDPLQVMKQMGEFKPDLILMDMYMPECNGIELAKVIRQIETYMSIPIVFLSVETNLDKQLTAMRLGGDDFLTKPILPEHLISSVSIRAERMRIIRSFMDRDSLTGLLNHTRIKTELDIALERVRRQKSKLVFAMIDLDHFKSINDTYGHPVGDRVILSLSRLLHQRLRKSDIVGRYGGEEFAVILYDTKAEDAQLVLDLIRQSFAQIKHQAENREFIVTFSCGISGFPEFAPATIPNAADKALYKAKNEGRNRVIIADESM